MSHIVTENEVQNLLSRVTFDSPPPANRGPVKANPYQAFWVEVRRMLIENPGRWALVLPDTGLSVVHRITRGANPQIDPETFEYTARAVKDHPKRHVTLYLRYIGENGEFADDA